MAQVVLDVLYDVKGLGALKQSQAVLNGASKATDKAAVSTARLGKAVGGVGGKAAASAVGVKAFGAASKYASAGVKALGASIASTLGPIAAATAIIGAFGAGLKTISDVDFSAAKLRSLGVDAGKLGKELRGVTKELEGQASQAELMGAAYDVASAGFTDAADAANVLTAASKGATGGFSDINTVANATTSVLNAYGKSASDAEKLVDQFIQTQNDGKIVIGEYAANISKVAPVAAALGIELGEVNAIISQVTATGTKAEVAFTGLKTALARLASGEANKALEEIGYSVSAAELEAKGLVGVLEEMKAQGITVGQAFQAFGTEAGPVIQAVFNDLDKVNRLLENQKNSAGAAAAAQSQAANTIQGAWKSVQTAFSNLFADQSAFGAVIKVALQGLAFVITDIGNRLNMILAPFKIFLQTVGLVVGKIKELGAAFMGALQSTGEWQKVSALFQVIQKWIGKAGQQIMDLLAPAFETALDWAKQFGEYVGKTLWGAIDGLIQGLIRITSVIPGLKGLSEQMAAAWNGFKTEVEQANEALNKTEVKPDLEQQIKDLQVEADVLGQKLQGALAAETASIDNALRVTQARYAAEQQIVDARLQAANAGLEAATTDEARATAAREIYEQTVRQAELTYNSTVAAAEAEEQKLAAQARYIAGQVKIQQMKLAEAQAAKTVTDAHYEAVNQAQQALQIAQQNIQAQQQITDAIVRGADATLAKQVEAARVTMEMQMQTQQQAQTNAQISEGANQMSRLANEAQRAAAASAGIGGGGGGALGRSQNLLGGSSITVDNSHKIYDKYKLSDGKIVETSQAEREQQMNQARLNKMNTRSKIAQSWDAAWEGTDYDAMTYQSWRRGGIIGPTGSQMYQAAIANAPPGIGNLAEAQNKYMQGYAEGGYVTGPQQAIVGEGGEPEYILPASKLDGAMQRYAAGMRGSSMIPSSADVTVNYSGSTVDMGGSSYINKGDVTGIVSQAVNQTLTKLQRSSKARLTAGLR